MELDVRPRATTTLNGSAHLAEVTKNIPLNLYKNVPFGQLTLEECEDLVRQRLEALYVMETSKTPENKGILSQDVANRLRGIKSYVFKANCMVLNRNDTNTQRLDQLSHMLLRLFCVYRSDLWPWFKFNEKRLFLFRLRDFATSFSGAQLEEILRSFNFSFQKVIGSELGELIQEKLILDKNKNDVFKVHFTAALRFISNRSVALKDGYAFLSRHDIISVVGDAFERHLENELAHARQHLKLEDLQIRRLVESMGLVHQDFTDKVEEQNRLKKRNQSDENKRPFAIEMENINDLVRDHYPPCMRYLHESLVADHHLKHTGRLHYGAFLRSGQVDLDTAIEFWRKEFTKKIPNEKFERHYKYNIRHLYGKEGSNKNGLSCFSCDKIISSVPGTAEKHGCPFKHSDDTHLKSMLIKHGLKEVDIESIIAKKNQGDAKMACTAYFEYSKGHELSDTIRNPIQFYYESRRVANRPRQEQLPDLNNQQVCEVPREDNDPAMEFDD